MTRVIRHPVSIGGAGVLLFVYGTVFGNLVAIIVSPIFVYLAWHIHGQRKIETVGEKSGQPSPSVWRVVQVSIAIGLLIGAVQSYVRLIGLGWRPITAAVTAGAIAAVVGGLFRLIIARLWT